MEGARAPERHTSSRTRGGEGISGTSREGGVRVRVLCPPLAHTHTSHLISLAHLTPPTSAVRECSVSPVPSSLCPPLAHTHTSHLISLAHLTPPTSAVRASSVSPVPSSLCPPLSRTLTPHTSSLSHISLRRQAQSVSVVSRLCRYRSARHSRAHSHLTPHLSRTSHSADERSA